MKTLATEGLHKMKLTKLAAKEAVPGIKKYTFVFEVLDENCSPVLRTFTSPKDIEKIVQFLTALNGKKTEEVPQDLAGIKSAIFEGYLKSSQNGKYTNLVGTPKLLTKSSINTHSPVI